MPLTLVTPPEEEPVTLNDMAQHLRRMDTEEDDEFIESLIAAALEMIEQATGRAFINQTWRLTLRDFPTTACQGSGTPRHQAWPLPSGAA